MDSASVSTWKRTLDIQGFGISAEHVPSAVASRSAEADHCKDGWKYATQIKIWKKKKIMKEIIIIQMVVAVAVVRETLAEEDVEDAEEAEEVAQIVSI
jgi:hypothetical protein